MSESGLEITLFFPAYNEEANLAGTISAASAALSPTGRNYELLIVDDGSRDNTPAIADRLAAADPHVRVVHQQNGGYGVALATGFREARGQLIAFSDSDLQFDLAELGLLLARLDAGDVDAVIGYRIKRMDPAQRIFIAAVYNRLTALLFDLRLANPQGTMEPVRDIDCALKVFKRSAIEGIPLASLSPFRTAELLIKLGALRVPMAQVGVHHYPRTAGENTGASPRKVLRTLRDLGMLRLRLTFARKASLGQRAAQGRAS
jgi:glycosyltransferase involved in cell wall biosynthesis